MNRIVSNSYTNKLDNLIDEYVKSSRITSLIDFFEGEIQIDQKRKSNRRIFSEKVNSCLIEIKKGSNEINKIFAYVNIILNAFQGQSIHIHINDDLSESVIESLTYLFFWDTLINSSFNLELLNDELNAIVRDADAALQLPENNQRIIDGIYLKRFGQLHRIKLLKKIVELIGVELNNGKLLNLNTGVANWINVSEYSKFSDALNTCVNFGGSLQGIYDNNNSILQKITTIINLFPTERGKNIWYGDFLVENINSWNQLPEFNFCKVITITTGEKSIELLREMQKKNRFQTEEFYTIFSFEI
jgi:hypothetical protein